MNGNSRHTEDGDAAGNGPRMGKAMTLVPVLLAAMVLGLPAPGVFAGTAGETALNRYRASMGLAPVSASRKLRKAAESHASDMARNGFFSHTGSNGSSIGERVRRQGYRFCFVAENIAKGQETLADVMQDWANSPGHRQNMLNRKATEFALVRMPDNIWVMVLGQPGC